MGNQGLKTLPAVIGASEAVVDVFPGQLPPAGKVFFQKVQQDLPLILHAEALLPSVLPGQTDIQPHPPQSVFSHSLPPKP